MANTLNIRRRIRSIKNTRQITRAMELVAATKMRRAQMQALRGRTYALLAWDLLRNLAEKVEDGAHVLLRRPQKVKSVAIVLMSSNRGLAGSFNSQVINETLSYVSRLRKENPDIALHLLTIGKKGQSLAAKAKLRLEADFKKIDVDLRVSDITPVSSMVAKKFLQKEYDAVVVAYMDFVSSLVQKARIKQLLPFPRLSRAAEAGIQDDLGIVTQADKEARQVVKEKLQLPDYIFEPTPDDVLEKLLPRLLEMQFYQAALETNASEHSARMVAMKNATDAAGDLISDLTLEYNQIRQASITGEIAEISAGRLAVS